MTTAEDLLTRVPDETLRAWQAMTSAGMLSGEQARPRPEAHDDEESAPITTLGRAAARHLWTGLMQAEAEPEGRDGALAQGLLHDVLACAQALRTANPFLAPAPDPRVTRWTAALGDWNMLTELPEWQRRADHWGQGPTHPRAEGMAGRVRALSAALQTLLSLEADPEPGGLANVACGLVAGLCQTSLSSDAVRHELLNAACAGDDVAAQRAVALLLAHNPTLPERLSGTGARQAALAACWNPRLLAPLWAQAVAKAVGETLPYWSPAPTGASPDEVRALEMLWTSVTDFIVGSRDPGAYPLTGAPRTPQTWALPDTDPQTLLDWARQHPDSIDAMWVIVHQPSLTSLPGLWPKSAAEVAAYLEGLYALARAMPAEDGRPAGTGDGEAGAEAAYTARWLACMICGTHLDGEADNDVPAHKQAAERARQLASVTWQPGQRLATGMLANDPERWVPELHEDGSPEAEATRAAVVRRHPDWEVGARGRWVLPIPRLMRAWSALNWEACLRWASEHALIRAALSEPGAPGRLVSALEAAGMPPAEAARWSAALMAALERQEG